MSSPATIPELIDVGVTPEGLWHSTFRAMACHVRLLLGAETVDPDACRAEVRDIFVAVERQCTRFDDASDLMRANVTATGWRTVGAFCYRAIHEAARAYERTDGIFDPRVLSTLRRLGYDRSLPFADGRLELRAQTSARPAPAGPWAPEFDAAAQAVRIGPHPIDLGGIGKGLALRWAADALGDGAAFLLDAGGDCIARGAGPDGKGWLLGVEDPRGGTEPMAVLRITDKAVATSSTRLRHWQVGGVAAHHLIDPRTGTPGGDGIRAVTVIGPDPAEAEVWTKVVFLRGPALADAAARDGFAVLWVDETGALHISDAAAPYVTWRRP